MDSETVVEPSEASRQQTLKLELQALRERQGVSVERIEASAPCLMSHRSVTHEIKLKGLGPGDRASAALSVLECHVRSDGWHPHARLLLLKTLNFEGDPGSLDDRRGRLWNTLKLGPSAYQTFERNTYSRLAQRVSHSETSPCAGAVDRTVTDMLAIQSLENAIRLAGVGDYREGARKIRRFLETDYPIALATFTPPSEQTAQWDHSSEPDGHRVLSLMLRAVAAQDYEQSVLVARVLNVPIGPVLPADLLHRLNEYLVRERGGASRLSFDLFGRYKTIYLQPADEGANPQIVIDNTVGLVARIMEKVERNNGWTAAIKAAHAAISRPARAHSPRAAANGAWDGIDDLLQREKPDSE